LCGSTKAKAVRASPFSPPRKVHFEIDLLGAG
jgi:hypothetical protein